MWVYSLSTVQIGYIVSLSEQRLSPPPHNIDIENIGITDEGDLLIVYKQYGVSRCKRISREDTFQSIAEKDNLPNQKEMEDNWFKEFNAKMGFILKQPKSTP